MDKYGVWVFVLSAVAIYLIVFFFSSIIKQVFRFGIKTAVGILGLAAFNYTFAASCISINLFTCGLCGIFGIPGLLLLIGTKLLYM